MITSNSNSNTSNSNSNSNTRRRNLFLECAANKCWEATCMNTILKNSIRMRITSLSHHASTGVMASAFTGTSASFSTTGRHNQVCDSLQASLSSLKISHSFSKHIYSPIYSHSHLFTRPFTLTLANTTRDATHSRGTATLPGDAANSSEQKT